MATRVCDRGGCTVTHYAKGLCRTHYHQTPERRAASAVGMARWRATPEGLLASSEAKARYMATDKGRADELERSWAKTALRRAIRAGAVIGDVPPDTRAILIARYGETCLVDGCDNAATDVDHVVALADGGIHDISNFQTLCNPCNQSKRTKTIDYRPYV